MLGFAPFNRPVAKVFLGDVGSLPIGLLLGWCLLEFAWHGQAAAALLLPAYYLADSTITLGRRIARREPFLSAHRTHFYQRATDNGFTVRRVISEVFLLNLVLALLAVVTVRASSTAVALLALLAGAIAVGFLLRRFSRPQASGLDKREPQAFVEGGRRLPPGCDRVGQVEVKRGPADSAGLRRRSKPWDCMVRPRSTRIPEPHPSGWY
jgi:hypothetical protein